MDVEIKQVPALRVAGLRHLGAYHEIGAAFGRLHSLLGGPEQFPAGTLLLAVYHDDPATTPEAELRSDAAIVLAADAAVPAGLSEQRLAAGRYAVALHHGSYAGLPQAWQSLMAEWLPRSGQRLGPGPSYELYLNTPMNTPEGQLRTELYAPLA